ncbi:unnamed protein product [Umbelopsis ramanniana]
MAAKRKVPTKKGKVNSFKEEEKKPFNKGKQHGSKFGKKNVEEKPMSTTKAKKKEFQAKRYNKKTKKTEEDDEDSEFEVVPDNATKPSTLVASKATNVDYNSDDDSDDDGAVDMFGSVGSKAAIGDLGLDEEGNDIEDGVDHISDNSDDDDKFIAAENLNANRKKKKSGGFQSMGLSQNVFKAISHKGFKVPTPIQRKCVPIIMEGNDVVGMARTGSGKTAAFLIPMLEKLKAHSAKVGARAIVLSPSRELALQTQKVAKELGKYTDLRSCIIVGGDSLEEQFSMIASNPDIIIATPGRLLHLIVEMNLDIKTVEYVVFDEADRLFEMGFAVQLHEILSRLPQSRQTLLFSATLPKLLVDFAKAGLQDPTLVRLDVDTKISKDLEMAFFNIKQQEKEAALLYILRNVIKLSKTTPYSADSNAEQDKKKKKFKKPVNMGDLHQTIVFASTKHHVEYLANLLMLVGYQVSYVYGTLDQTARHIQINNFRNGISNIMVVTDVAARGIDIPILENVINYDFVDSSKVFIHRVGRAARAGRRGWAYSLITPEELPYLMDLQLFLSRKLVCGSSEANEKGYDFTSDIVMGSVPRELIDDDSEWVRSRVAADAELTGYQQTAINGYKLYCRTRPSAAAESYTRAKELLKSLNIKDPHPLVVNDLNTASQQSRSALLSSITNFRPQETIFEVGQRGTRKTSEATMVMRSRRKAVAKVIDAHKFRQAEKTLNVLDTFKGPEMNGNNDEADTHVNLGGDVDDEELMNTFKMTDDKPVKKFQSGNPAGKSKKPASYKDSEFYMSYTQADANTEKGYSMNSSGNFAEQAAKASLDLVGDERETMTQKKNQLRWDSKKKKFVQGTGIGSDNKKMIRTESGALISASFKSGRFDDWSKKTKLAIPRAGEQELSTARNKMGQKRYRHTETKEAKPLDPKAMDYEHKLKKRKRQEEEDPNADSRAGKKGGMGSKRVGTMKNARNELKGTDQIRRDRAQKEQRREKNARHTKKGKKGGRR